MKEFFDFINYKEAKPKLTLDLEYDEPDYSEDYEMVCVEMYKSKKILLKFTRNREIFYDTGSMHKMIVKDLKGNVIEDTEPIFLSLVNESEPIIPDETSYWTYL